MERCAENRVGEKPTGIQNVPEARTAVGRWGAGAGSLANLVALVNVLSGCEARRCVQVRHPYAHLKTEEVLARRAPPSLRWAVFTATDAEYSLLACQRAWRTFVEAMAYLVARARARVHRMTHFDDYDDGDNDAAYDDGDNARAWLRLSFLEMRISPRRKEMFDCSRIHAATCFRIEGENCGKPVAQRDEDWGRLSIHCRSLESSPRQILRPPPTL